MNRHVYWASKPTQVAGQLDNLIYNINKFITS